MSTANHTKGKWVYSEALGVVYVGEVYDGVGSQDICQLDNNRESFKNAKANGDLIAAAPDLLEALENVRDEIHERMSDKARFMLKAEDDAEPYLSSRGEVQAYRTIRTAIAKARGQS